MQKFFFTFREKENGAVTVDWVVLTAAVVGLATAIVFGIMNANEGLGAKMKDYLLNTEIG